ncbi:N-acetylmuramoyl-L-alanine amidase [Filimonas zeae]|uniref:N-acetylmuramoyl-L-alanine amidase n=1 Tax=Filimonas zeae TaxID=1737353 RepID=A0A917J2A0_9BACT|nr:N-acetylmuramoyl-L-alanine amidase [Filimonas zeae]
MYISCASHPFRATNSSYRAQTKTLAATVRSQPAADSVQPPAYWVGTTNFNLRKPNFVIIHHTAQQSCEQTLKTFTLERTQVSAHYVICKDGTVHHMLNDYLRAWHAGAARWGNTTDINSSSIGIEIDNNGTEAFTEAQITSLLRLLGRLKRDYAIPAANFIGHSDIAPGRKVDPSAFFPWQQLAQNGYGLWYDTTGVQVPADFNTMQALRIIGYQVKDSAAAIHAFKLHFMPSDTTASLTDDNRRVLFDLARKYE